MNPDAFAKRGRPATLTNEELLREPKKAKLHAHHYVPLDFFRQAIDDPSTFLEPTKATSESISKEEKASSSTTDDEDSSTASTASVTGNEPAKRFGLYSECLLRDCYMDLMREINDEITARNERIDSDGDTGSYLIVIRGSAGIGLSRFSHG
jgi:hypothetical protein